MEDNFDFRSFIYNNPLLKESEDSYKKYGLDDLIKMLKDSNFYHEGVKMLKGAIEHANDDNWMKNTSQLTPEEAIEYKSLLNKLSDKWIGKELKESKEEQIWNSLLNEQKLEALLQVIKDPNDAERFIYYKWNKLPSEIATNIHFKYINLNENESIKGLMVFGKTQLDNNKIKNFIQNSDFHAEWKPNGGYWLFNEDPELYDELEKQLDSEFALLDINARFEGIFENITHDNSPGPGSDSPHREEAPNSTGSDKYKNEIDNFLRDLALIHKEFEDYDGALDQLHNDIFYYFPTNTSLFNEMWEELVESPKYSSISRSFRNKFRIDTDGELKYIYLNLVDVEEDDITKGTSNSNSATMNEINKIKEIVKKTLKEMSVTGGGGAGASFSAGIGMNYATPKAFKKLKKKK